ncbi:DEAD/DEAH box helicase family protein [Bifidobacterium catulorum]|uniref:Restriction endonuclease n=1 Tax=Bifidobacterium catulorum TaxID=1630173 RepID=A0A2U2MSL5_9BIFI|nr:DEAD/DEAH box helicase family protein [Bifidobacterium catulorum]PWG59845.1 restriction endonuclease [Bifidobacterium catulorum]
MALQFQYSSDQQYQLDAINAVTDLFQDQQFRMSRFTAGETEQWMVDRWQSASDDTVGIGFANDLRVSERRLMDGLHAVQERNCLPRTQVLTDGRLRDFTVEMETGTGKTYVYIRTIYELHQRYGLTKFIIVVPSVAIREGVKKSFETMKEHFDTLYDGAPLDYFVYDSNNMGPVGNFAMSSSIQVMIINIGAFNKAFDKNGEDDKSNLFHRKSEKLAGGRSPQELVSECHPIVIIDEPQSVDNTAKAKKAIRSLNPLFVLRYSATHKEAYNMVYRLTPVDAFQEHLVKGICVDSVLSQANLNGSYVRLDSVSRDPYRAKVTLDVKQKDGGQKRKSVQVKVGQDLYERSGYNTDYKAGWIVSNIDTAEGMESIEFQNGDYLELGEAKGDVSETLVKRAQIRRTIEDHLESQLEMHARGVKVLSLFFIDKVGKYREYQDDGTTADGEYACMFDEEYRDLVNSTKWERRYEKAGIPLIDDPMRVRTAYFSEDRKRRFKDTRGNTAADTDTFQLIMRKKETLISFPDGKDPEKDYSFIFSHSALKEGWDNPNVFQICTLVETKDTMTKRQKIGRGLRLCVDQTGRRCFEPEANTLTVIANESYNDFANGLQSEFEQSGFRFGVLTPESFTSLHLLDDEGKQTEALFGFDNSKAVYDHLASTGLITGKGEITETLKTAVEEDTLDLPDEFEPMRDQIEQVIAHKAEKLQIKDKSEEVEVQLNSDAVQSDAFRELWKRIRPRTKFELNVDSDQLVEKSIEYIGEMEKIRPVEIHSYRSTLDIDDAGVTAGDAHMSMVDMAQGLHYDLPDPIRELQDVVGLTRKTLKRILEECGRLDEFTIDPVTFITQVAACIQKAKRVVLPKGITYTKLPEDEWYKVNVLSPHGMKGYLKQNAFPPSHVDKWLYDYVVYDSTTIERPYAQQLDRADDVLFCAKLPDSFVIDTPFGSYNPDWAYVEEKSGKQKVYFVIETKGGKNGIAATRPEERSKIDCAEVHFAELAKDHPDLEYDVRTQYDKVMQ